MSLTQEDLKAISDLIDVKLTEQEKRISNRFDQVDIRFEQIDKRFDEQDKRFNKKFDEQDKRFNERFDEQDKRFDKKFDDFRTEFKEMLIENNILIAEHVQRIVSESEERLSKQINDIKNVTAQNCFDIAVLKNKVS